MEARVASDQPFSSWPQPLGIAAGWIPNGLGTPCALLLDMTNEIADLAGTVGYLTAKLWDELATCGSYTVAVEWVGGNPMVGDADTLVDAFAYTWPGIGCDEFLSLGETAELLAVLGWDADTGDALVQYACFGELRYG